MDRSHFTIKRGLEIVLVAALLAGTQADGQEHSSEGGFQANVGLYFDYNDNLYDNGTEEVESWIARISPELSLSSAPGSRQFSLLYLGDYAKFFESSRDDYADHSFTGRGLFQMGSRGKLDIAAVFAQDHDNRGSGLTRGLGPGSPNFPTEPDQSDRIGWNAQYTYGAAGARGRLNFGLGSNSLEYSTSRDRTQFFNRNDDFAFGGITIGARGGRSAFVIEARYTDAHYDVDRPGEASLSGDNWRALVGFTWEATARTEGSISIGAKRRSFDDAARETDTGLSWEVAVRWSPRKYSYFDFDTARENQETIGDGNFIDRKSYGISWTHEWATRLQSVLRWNRREEDFVGTNRQEEQTETYFGLRLPQGERVLWEAGVSRRDRTSTLSDLEYEGTLFTIGVNLQLFR